MTGYDKDALEYMLRCRREDHPGEDETAAARVYELALAYDLAYMGEAGVLKDGEYTDEFYDDDDAYDFIITRLSAALENTDGFDLADLTDEYFEYHDRFMEENDLVHWE